jgi:hypothetical protein
VRLYELFFGAFLIVGLVGWLRSWRGRCRLALFLCVYVFKSEIRFRVPFDVFFMPVALSGWTSIVFRLETGRKDETGNA